MTGPRSAASRLHREAAPVRPAEDYSMATVQAVAEEYVLLENISWETYEKLLRDSTRRGIRFTYDEGSLEIMTLGLTHEHFSILIQAMIQVLTLELNISIFSGGSTT